MPSSIQFLTSVGNIIGRCPYYQVESDYHRTNLFCVMVGQSSKARKGTSAGRVHAVVGPVDEQWLDSRVKGGLSSGEGLINEVRDEVKKWNGKDGTWEVVDPGVSDKRLMVYEPEFAGALLAADRHGNLLSQIIRKAWDGGKLETLTKSSPALRYQPAYLNHWSHNRRRSCALVSREPTLQTGSQTASCSSL